MRTPIFANQNVPAMPPLNSEAAWEVLHSDFLSQSQKLGMNDYNVLKECLSDVVNADPYAVSPAYYLMTCRKGLWIHRQGRQFILFGWHPNITGQMLIFNPLHTSDTLQIFLKYLPVTPAGSLVARVQETVNEYAQSVPENILDWGYPVYTLSTQAVTTHKGTCFRDLRKNLYRVDENKVSIKPLQDHIDFIDALKLINKWSSSRESDGYKLEDLSDPQVYILKLMKSHPDFFEGFLAYHDNNVAGLCLWEKSHNETISSFISVSRPDIRGLSDYVIHQMCQKLQGQGITKVCIGGSESAGLDAYKRKFNPVKSLPLQSMPVAVKSALNQAA